MIALLGITGCWLFIVYRQLMNTLCIYRKKIYMCDKNQEHFNNKQPSYTIYGISFIKINITAAVAFVQKQKNCINMKSRYRIHSKLDNYKFLIARYSIINITYRNAVYRYIKCVLLTEKQTCRISNRKKGSWHEPNAHINCKNLFLLTGNQTRVASCKLYKNTHPVNYYSLLYMPYIFCDV